MKLISGVDYDVWVVMPTRRLMRCTMVYCGGSMVDNNGHHVAFGNWCKGLWPNRLTICSMSKHRTVIIPIPGTGRSDGCTFTDDGEIVRKGEPYATVAR